MIWASFQEATLAAADHGNGANTTLAGEEFIQSLSETPTQATWRRRLTDCYHPTHDSQSHPRVPPNQEADQITQKSAYK
eukprot:4397742-Amphidinium_carterae.1